jgi:hypothetical protein
VSITSACVAVFVTSKGMGAKIYFGVVSVLFAYFTVANVYDRPDGLKIATFFIGAIMIISLVSRSVRSLEVRVGSVKLDEAACAMVHAAAANGVIRIFAHKPQAENPVWAYEVKEAEMRRIHSISETALFLEVELGDVSDFKDDEVLVTGHMVGGHRVLRCRSVAVPNAIAALELYLRDVEHDEAHVYFSWSDKGPLANAIRYFWWGQGETAAVAREVLRRAEKDGNKRPYIHVA